MSQFLQHSTNKCKEMSYKDMTMWDIMVMPSEDTTSWLAVSPSSLLLIIPCCLALTRGNLPVNFCTADYEQLCNNAPKPHNTTCSWRGFPERKDKQRSAEDWFRGCACFMINAWE